MTDYQDVDICDVCWLVDGDQRLKPVRYCGRCDANICDQCRLKPMRRAYAMFKRKALRLFGVTA